MQSQKKKHGFRYMESATNTVVTSKLGLHSGWSLDIPTADEQGKTLDLGKAIVHHSTMQLINAYNTELIVVLPSFTDCCASTVNINHSRIDPPEVKQQIRGTMILL